MTRQRASLRQPFTVIFTALLLLMISIAPTQQNDLIPSRQQVQSISNMRHTRQAKSQLHARQQPGLFNLRRNQLDIQRKAANITVTLTKYSNPKFALSDGNYCNCPIRDDNNKCLYLTNIASPCFFSFSVFVNTLSGVTFNSTEFIPFNGTLENKNGNNPFKKINFYDLDTVPISIDVFVYQLGPVIDSSGQAIYVDYLVLADQFDFEIENNRDVSDFSRPSSQPVQKFATNPKMDTSIELVYSISCRPNFYGSHCDMTCVEQASSDASKETFVCTLPKKTGNFSYLCSSNSADRQLNSNLMTNCTPCAYRNNDCTICETFDRSSEPSEPAIYNSDLELYWYIFAAVLIFLLIIILLLLIHIVRERRRNQVYGDKENFFSPTSSSDLDPATGGRGGNGTDGTAAVKRAGRHFTIDHELPPNAVKRGLSPPRSPFYEMSSSSGSTASERVSSGGVQPPVDRADYSGYAGVPAERREALV